MHMLTIGMLFFAYLWYTQTHKGKAECESQKGLHFNNLQFQKASCITT